MVDRHKLKLLCNDMYRLTRDKVYFTLTEKLGAEIAQDCDELLNEIGGFDEEDTQN